MWHCDYWLSIIMIIMKRVHNTKTLTFSHYRPSITPDHHYTRKTSIAGDNTNPVDSQLPRSATHKRVVWHFKLVPLFISLFETWKVFREQIIYMVLVMDEWSGGRRDGATARAAPAPRPPAPATRGSGNNPSCREMVGLRQDGPTTWLRFQEFDVCGWRRIRLF